MKRLDWVLSGHKPPKTSFLMTWLNWIHENYCLLTIEDRYYKTHFHLIYAAYLFKRYFLLQLVLFSFTVWSAGFATFMFCFLVHQDHTFEKLIFEITKVNIYSLVIYIIKSGWNDLQMISECSEYISTIRICCRRSFEARVRFVSLH